MGRVKSDQRVKDDPFEMIIYRLSPVLGGRSEVLDTPLEEALGYLGMERRERKKQKFDTFMMIYFSANSRVDGKARKKYMDELKPKEQATKLLNRKQPLEWDYSMLDEFRAK